MSEIGIEDVLVALVVDVRYGQGSNRAIPARTQTEHDRVDVTLPAEEAGADLVLDTLADLGPQRLAVLVAARRRREA